MADEQGFPRRMTNADSIMWNMERDPILRSTVVTVALLDHVPDWREVRRRFLAAGEEVPRLRQRVATAPYGNPVWEHDPRFEPQYHLRRARVAAPGDAASVFEHAAQFGMGAFDRARPLWQMMLLEGLDDDRAALILKFHHSMTDGVGAIRLAMALFDDRPDPVRRLHPLAASGAQAGRGPDLSLRRAVPALAGLARRSVGVVGRALADPAGEATRALDTARWAGRLVAPVTRPLSPILVGRSLSWHYDAFDVPLAPLRDAAHLAGCSLNDAYMSAVAGGLARYHRLHGAAVNDLRITLPVSIRRPGDPLGGNRFTPVRFPVPVAIADPVERMKAVHNLVKAWREGPAMPLTDRLAAVLNALPPAVTTQVFGQMLKNVDFVATNIPGYPVTVYLAGAEILDQYAFSPLTGAAVNVSLLSYVDRCCIGVNTDGAAVHDPPALTASLRAGFDEVASVATPAAAAGS
ncbi:MAG TPA: wax ester/triacylglycerol synthase family O-acyltransferase [Acidimicrobiales bacterium]|nr:wax ester/triacylglycerol synthase family O-acyltransferase [Acidimicrobiales bacterium]